MTQPPTPAVGTRCAFLALGLAAVFASLASEGWEEDGSEDDGSGLEAVGALLESDAAGLGLAAGGGLGFGLGLEMGGGFLPFFGLGALM